MMAKLFGSKKEQPQAPPPKPTFDTGNKEQLKEMEKDYKRQLNKEMRELERGILRKCFFL